MVWQDKFSFTSRVIVWQHKNDFLRKFLLQKLYSTKQSMRKTPTATSHFDVFTYCDILSCWGWGLLTDLITYVWSIEWLIMSKVLQLHGDIKRFSAHFSKLFTRNFLRHTVSFLKWHFLLFWNTLNYFFKTLESSNWNAYF